MTNRQTLIDKFFSDPDWAGVEEMIVSYVEPLLKMEDVDINQPAEHVKAEVIARQKAYKCLMDFLNENKLVTRKGTVPSNPFK